MCWHRLVCFSAPFMAVTKSSTSCVPETEVVLMRQVLPSCIPGTKGFLRQAFALVSLTYFRREAGCLRRSAMRSRSWTTSPANRTSSCSARGRPVVRILELMRRSAGRGHPLLVLLPVDRSSEHLTHAGEREMLATVPTEAAATCGVFDSGS